MKATRCARVADADQRHRFARKLAFTPRQWLAN